MEKSENLFAVISLSNSLKNLEQPEEVIAEMPDIETIVDDYLKSN